jgi:chromosome segregation ATPase
MQFQVNLDRARQLLESAARAPCDEEESVRAYAQLEAHVRQLQVALVDVGSVLVKSGEELRRVEAEAAATAAKQAAATEARALAEHELKTAQERLSDRTTRLEEHRRAVNAAHADVDAAKDRLGRARSLFISEVSQWTAEIEAARKKYSRNALEQEVTALEIAIRELDASAEEGAAPTAPDENGGDAANVRDDSGGAEALQKQRDAVEANIRALAAERESLERELKDEQGAEEWADTPLEELERGIAAFNADLPAMTDTTRQLLQDLEQDRLQGALCTCCVGKPPHIGPQSIRPFLVDLVAKLERAAAQAQAQARTHMFAQVQPQPQPQPQPRPQPPGRDDGAGASVEGAAINQGEEGEEQSAGAESAAP